MLKPNVHKKFPLVEVDEPNLLRDLFPYTKPPRIEYDNIHVPTDLSDDIWITDTTFRDGQQARTPYTIEQSIEIFKFLHKIGGAEGVIKNSEFFLFSDKDKQVVEAVRDLDYDFPEITSWIRASKKDVELVKEMKIKETGVLTSVSDYHIFLKLKSDRKKILDKYLGITKDLLDLGVLPRLHFEDITRSDIYGFVLPFAAEVKKLADESKIPIKIRLCDTMGYGIPFVASSLPRSVPKLFYLFRKEIGLEHNQLEWHGHNDFHFVMANSMSCWMYGGASVNGTLLGFGERTGNTPIEGLLLHYIGMTGKTHGIDTQAITEMAEYFKRELNTHIPDNYPFAGAKFNVTRAGIHADGVIKNEEIYNIFDTKRILSRPLGVIVTDKSGVAGIALWINMHYNLPKEKEIDKKHPGVSKIYTWVMKEYNGGRITGLADEEIEAQVKKYLPEVIYSEYDKLKNNVKKHSLELLEKTADFSEVKSGNFETMRRILDNVIEENKHIQLITFVKTDGKLVTACYKSSDKLKYKTFTNEHTDFSDSDWFIEALNKGKIFTTNFYTSQYTKELCMTLSTSVTDESDHVIGVLAFDIQFEAALKLE